MEARTDISRAYDKIVELIANGELRPGERTSVIALAQRLDLGRTPVKEAITRLQTQGLLVVKGRSGTSVSEMDAKTVRQLFSVRRLLEDHAAAEAVLHATALDIKAVEANLATMRRAAQAGDAGLSGFINADVAFHTTLVRAAKNPVLDRLYSSVKMHLQIVIYLHFGGARKSGTRNSEHATIVLMLKKRDKRGLQRALREHSRAVEKEIAQVLASKRITVAFGQAMSDVACSYETTSRINDRSSLAR